MQSLLILPALMVLAGAAVTAPAVENSSNRAILYWLVLPSLATLRTLACLCCGYTARGEQQSTYGQCVQPKFLIAFHFHFSYPSILRPSGIFGDNLLLDTLLAVYQALGKPHCCDSGNSITNDSMPFSRGRFTAAPLVYRLQMRRAPFGRPAGLPPDLLAPPEPIHTPF